MTPQPILDKTMQFWKVLLWKVYVFINSLFKQKRIVKGIQAFSIVLMLVVCFFMSQFWIKTF